MSRRERWRVAVAYATAQRQEVLEVETRPGATLEQVIRTSGILERCPEIDLSRQRVGVFGELAVLGDLVHDGDRIEIYRPLLADPKEARRRRARKSRARGGK